MLPNPSEPLLYQSDRLIHEAFLWQCRKFPYSVAISSRYGEISYEELELFSRRVATLLINRLNFGHQRKVAIIADRNPALIFSILGALRAGAAFLVIDSAYPSARISTMISKWKPALILDCCNTDSTAEFNAEQIPLVKVPCNQDDLMVSFIEDQSDQIDIIGHPEDIAYALFTSGTTGQPKGILTNHTPLVHFINWHVREHNISSSDRISFLSGLSHDPALRDIFTPLSIGATLVIPEQSVIFDPETLISWLSRNNITVCHLTPALGEIIALGANINSKELTTLKYLFWGGDLLSINISQRLRAIAPQAVQINFYGATETPQAMGYFVIPSLWQGGVFPIGRAINDAQLLVIKESGDLAQIGELGEIWIRSRYLSLGYLEEDQQTKSRYVINPFSDPLIHEDRCYRTGDFGKYLPDGNVLFTGRIDHQVKIRGYRVELSEISNTIERFSGVSRGFVIARESADGRKMLVGYFSCTDNNNVTASSLTRYLKEQLPSYMVPAVLVPITRFPLMPNGKIDIQALPCPLNPHDLIKSEKYESSESLLGDCLNNNLTNQREQELLKIWQAVLGHSRITVNDSFADLGGDSMTAIAVLVQMKRMGIADNVAKGIFQGWSIRQIAAGSNYQANDKKSDSTTCRLKLNMNVNAVRGILVAILVIDHWYDGILNYLPEVLHSTKDWLSIIFNLATPGFAIIFGLVLGYIYYPRYQHDTKQIIKLLATGALFVFVGMIIRADAKLAIALAHGEHISSTKIFSSYYSALMYYAIALLTAPFWFRIIGYGSRIYLRLAIMLIISYILYHLALYLWLDTEQVGIMQLFRLILVAKFNYFNMSIGAVAGIGAGIYLNKWSNSGRSLTDLTARFTYISILTTSFGLMLALLTPDGLATLLRSEDMGLHRWLFYSGMVALIFAAINIIILNYDNMNYRHKTIINLLAVLGQISLPMFILHHLVLDTKNLLETSGIPKIISITIPLIIFSYIIYILMRKLYFLYYSPTATSNN